MNLPFTGPGLPFVSVSDIPSLHKTLIIRRWFDDINSWRKGSDKDTDALQARENDLDQTFKPWDDFDEARFCALGRARIAEDLAKEEAREAKKEAEKKSAAEAKAKSSTMAARTDV